MEYIDTTLILQCFEFINDLNGNNFSNSVRFADFATVHHCTLLILSESLTLPRLILSDSRTLPRITAHV
jgi:hypothetical protein